MKDNSGVTAIYDYILYLKRYCGLNISLHPKPNDPVVMTTKLISFTIHSNPYCVFLKSYAQVRCYKCQKKVELHCQDGQSFSGTCFAGVKEYVYPFSDGQGVAGFISVSGYKTDDPSSYLRATAEKCALPIEDLEKVYESLEGELPRKDFVDTLVTPLCIMLEHAYMKATTDIHEMDFYQQILSFLRDSHNTHITSEDICRKFSCSRSSVSHLFKSRNGQSISEYLNTLRIEDAKALLQHSNLNILEISAAVGFDNSNYFSYRFKQKVGMSPQKYRAMHRASLK